MAIRSELRTRARARADQDSSTFPTDTQYNYWLDEAGKETWFDLVRAGWPIGYDTVAASLPSAGQARFADDLGITDSIAFVRGVFRQEGSTFAELKRLNEGDRAALMGASGSQASAYDITVHPTEGLMLNVYPPAAGTYHVQYTVEWPGFSSDASRWPGPARSDELVVLKAAIKGCRKEGNEEGARFLEGEYAYLQQCVQDMASWTNMRHSAMIRDVGDPLGPPTRLPGDFDIYNP